MTLVNGRGIGVIVSPTGGYGNLTNDGTALGPLWFNCGGVFVYGLAGAQFHSIPHPI